MKTILAVFLFATTLIAADATGTWSGTLNINEDQKPAHLVLKQEGTKVTGTAGPSANHQLEIRNGKAENGLLTFEVPEPDTVWKVSLKADGDAMKGDVTFEHDGELRHATIEVKRAE